ncbi:MAG: hypothetical protein ACYCYM_11245 [Saccharofermentanales bacterium]
MSNKAKLVPMRFESADLNEFNVQLECIRKLLVNEAIFLEPVTVGASLPSDTDAVVFPQLVGEAYKMMMDIGKISCPILIITSEYGTVAMWDWEIITFFKSKGLKVLTPYNLELTRTICRTLALQKDMKQTKFLVFQDNPGEGMQAGIFKRFYWWEDECSQQIYDRFGVTIEKRSFKKLADDAKQISDQEALRVLEERKPRVCDVMKKSMVSAAKMYLAIRQEIGGDKSIRGAGINCLNESFYSDTVPCLAWDLLFEDRELMWSCEADTLSLLTQYILYHSLRVPVMTSNIYPFLIGMAALKHERIMTFPQVEDPDNHLLIAHCGYFGLMPERFAAEWTLRPKVLAIVDENAVAVDARYPTGDVTLAKLHPLLNSIQVINGNLEGYAQYPDSDCKNGGLIKVQDGHKLMNSFYSHHSCIITRNHQAELDVVASILSLSIEKL